jgi:ATP-dependent helicase HrpA
MLLEADRLGCLDEVRAVVAGLSIIDVRQRPSDDEARAELATAGSGSRARTC